MRELVDDVVGREPVAAHVKDAIFDERNRASRLQASVNAVHRK